MDDYRTGYIDGVESRDMEVAALREQVKRLQDALRNLWNERNPDSYDEAGEALAATEPKE